MKRSNIKVLFVLPRFHTNLYWAIRALAEAGYSVSVLASTAETKQELHDVIVPIITTQMSSEDLAVIMEALSPDCIILRGGGMAADVATSYARNQSIPLIKYDQVPVPQRWQLYRWFRRMRDSNPVRFRISPVPRKCFSTKGNRREFFLPFPVSPGAARLQSPQSEKLRVLCVGKLLQPRKNHGHVLTAISNFPELAGRLELTICGTTNACSEQSLDYYRDLKRRGAELERIADVCFRENVEFNDMPQLYAAHDVCILPSYREPLGSAPLEAMSYGGIPFISREAGTSPYLTNGLNGHVIDPNDPFDTGAKLLQLVESQTFRAEMSSRAREFAQTELSGDAFVRRFEMILQRVCG